MTREEAIEKLELMRQKVDEETYRALILAIKALEQNESAEEWYKLFVKKLDEQEPCDDAISRDWLKTAIHNFYYGLKHTPSEEDIQAYIDAAPSVTPKPETVTEFADRCRECGARYGKLLKQKSGKWILLDECANSGYYCSNCQKKLVKEGWSNTVKKIKYCPNCGAKMESEDKE